MSLTVNVGDVYEVLLVQCQIGKVNIVRCSVNVNQIMLFAVDCDP